MNSVLLTSEKGILQTLCDVMNSSLLLIRSHWIYQQFPFTHHSDHTFTVGSVQNVTTVCICKHMYIFM